jgi:hypothetical protein
MIDKVYFNSNLKSRQMRALLFTILICIFYDISAQTDIYKYGKGFNSYFNNLKTGHFSGYVDGFLQLERYSGTKVLTSFTKDSAQLKIIRDSLEIYDVSTKHYIAKNSEIQIDYSTYSASNALVITEDNLKYKLNLISGACMLVITGLDYEYVMDGEYELLIIHFSDRVGLTVAGAIIPDIYVQKGSTLIFHIKK